MVVNIKGIWETGEVYINGEKLDLQESLKYINKSPTGFSWGYSGSGPAQLAFAILLKTAGEHYALKYYMLFKDLFIAGLPQSDFYVGDVDIFVMLKACALKMGDLKEAEELEKKVDKKWLEEQRKFIEGLPDSQFEMREEEDDDVFN